MNLIDTVLPNGEQISALNTDEALFVYNEIYEDETYLKHVKIRSDNPVFFDVGGNIGLFIRFMAQKYQNAQFYCFEPAPNCLGALRKNLATIPNVEIIDQAVSNRSGKATFSYYPNYTIMSGLHADSKRDLEILQAGASTQFEKRFGVEADERVISALSRGKMDDAIEFEVQTNPLSHFIDLHDVKKIDYLKVDVERAEGEVLSSISEQHWKLIENVVAEIHDLGGKEHEFWASELKNRGFSVLLEVEEGLKNSDIHVLYAWRD